jgi:methylase of polypeptide subunit release factors
MGQVAGRGPLSQEHSALTSVEGPQTHDIDGIMRLQTRLSQVGFTAVAVNKALGIQGSLERDLTQVPVYLGRLPAGDPLSTFVKLFQLSVPVDLDEAAHALRPLAIERVERMGLLRVVERVADPLVEISPVGDLLLVSDRTQRDADRPDHVLGLSPPASLLASLTVRELVPSALDLGAGSGIQALLAAQHATQVVATDINARALQFAEFNALLNGLANIEFRRGDLFAAVEGRAFDLIVCNPPYLVSPESRFIYRDNDLLGDAFCEQLVRQMPAYLVEGGFGHVLISWVHGETEEWSRPIRRWLGGSGCDGLLLRYASYDPLTYAAACNRHLSRDPTAYADTLDRWMDYYRRGGIESISWGAIVLRRRSSGENWFWSYSPPGDRMAPASEHILRLCAAQDYLQRLNNQQTLLQETFALVEGHRLEETVLFEDGVRSVQKSLLRLEGGLQPQVLLDLAAVRLLSAMDGRRVLQAALDQVAQTAGEPLADENVATSVLPWISKLVELGFLVPSSDQLP